MVWGTSLAVRWLGICLPMKEDGDSIPGVELRSHMLQLRPDTSKYIYFLKKKWMVWVSLKDGHKIIVTLHLLIWRRELDVFLWIKDSCILLERKIKLFLLSHGSWNMWRRYVGMLKRWGMDCILINLSSVSSNPPSYTLHYGAGAGTRATVSLLCQKQVLLRLYAEVIWERCLQVWRRKKELVSFLGLPELVSIPQQCFFTLATVLPSWGGCWIQFAVFPQPYCASPRKSSNSWTVPSPQRSEFLFSRTTPLNLSFNNLNTYLPLFSQPKRW